MLSLMSKLLLVMSMNLLLIGSVSAKVVEKEDIHFPLETEKLLAGETHYFFEIMTPRKLSMYYPEAFDLDSLSLNQESHVSMLITKSVMVLDQPVGFFNEQDLMSEKYMSHIMGEQKVKKLGADSYQITVPGKAAHSYKIQSYFDADNVSTLPNSKVIRALYAVKKLDVISQGAFTIVFTEKTQYTKYAVGGISVSSYIPLKEDKTLVITYQLSGIKQKYAKEEILKPSYLSELKAVKRLQQNYKN